MKRALTLLIGTAAITTSALATNGTQLIATTAKARAMGGVGVATYMGAGASNNNPALYSKEKGKAVSGGLTFFSAAVSYQDNNGKDTSDYGSKILPDIGYAHKINDDMVIGVGLTSVAGFGVDYSKSGDTAATTGGIKNELTIMQLNIPFAYDLSRFGAKGLSLGIAPVIQFSSLSTESKLHSDNASSTDVGVNLGVSYDISDFTLGMMYKLGITSSYGDKVLPYDLENPSTFGLGANWNISKSHSVAADYKIIAYGSASGYSDFDWKNQNIIALGYQYQADALALRLGYNLGSSVIEGESIAHMQTTYIGFPALTAAHYTLGGGYDFKGGGMIDAALVLGQSFNDSHKFKDAAGDPDLIKATNNQASITVDYTYAF